MTVRSPDQQPTASVALGALGRGDARGGGARGLGRGGHNASAHRPHNSLYVIDAGGQLVDRYDKRFCASDGRRNTGDLAHFSPGNHPSVFEIGGVHSAR